MSNATTASELTARRITTAIDRLAAAIADPGHVIDRQAHETVARWSTRAALVVMAALHPDDRDALLDEQPDPDHVRPVRYRPVQGPPWLTYWEFSPDGGELHAHLILKNPDNGTPGPTMCGRERFGPGTPGGGWRSAPRRPVCPDCLTVTGGLGLQAVRRG